jgi:hypothetical protein
VTQKDRLVAGFIVEDMLPLSTIESPRIRKILDKNTRDSQANIRQEDIFPLPEQVLYRHGIEAQNNFRVLPGSCVHHRRYLVRQQQKLGYLGMTVHWIDSIIKT